MHKPNNASLYSLFTIIRTTYTAAAINVKGIYNVALQYRHTHTAEGLFVFCLLSFLQDYEHFESIGPFNE